MKSVIPRSTVARGLFTELARRIINCSLITNVLSQAKRVFASNRNSAFLKLPNYEAVVLFLS